MIRLMLRGRALGSDQQETVLGNERLPLRQAVASILALSALAWAPVALLIVAVLAQ